MAADYSWVGPAITAANSFAINAINKWAKLSPNEKYNANWYAQTNYRYSQMAADADFGRNLAMWRMNNEYNSPAAQMARYKEAGLNPNLIYGQSNMASSPASVHSSAPNVPIMNQPFGQIEGLGELGSRIFDILDPDSTYNVAKEDAQEILRYHKAQSSSAESQSAIDSFEAQMIQERYKNALEDRNIENNKKLAEIENLNSRSNLTDEQKAYYKQQESYLKSQISVNNARIRNLDQNTQLAETQAGLNRQQAVFRENEELRAEENHAYVEWKRNFDTMDDKAREAVIEKATDSFVRTFYPNATEQDKKIIRSALRQGGKLLYNVVDGLFDIVK